MPQIIVENTAMNIENLRQRILSHHGEFICEEINRPSVRKTFEFRHLAQPLPAQTVSQLPETGDLRAFFQTVGSVHFFHEAGSGECARHIAPPAEWGHLREAFARWILGVGESREWETDDYEIGTPLAKCLVIGETPASGNFIFMPLAGKNAGRIYEFDHDGFEIECCGDNLPDYAARLIQPDGSRLANYASLMRFIENNDWNRQWWIAEMRDSDGRVVCTK